MQRITELDVSVIRRKAYAGDSEAQHELGWMYYHGGPSLSADYKAAAKWWRISADNGNLRALRDLVNMFYSDSNGERVPVLALAPRVS